MFKETSKFFRIIPKHGSNAMKLLYHAEVRWLCRGKVLNRMFPLRQQFFLLNKDTNGY